MSYVNAGYAIVLGILFLYGLNLLWRRRRLTRTVARVTDSRPAADGPGGSPGAGPGGSEPAPLPAARPAAEVG